MSPYEILNSRSTSLWNISVGTALALQSALGYSVEVPTLANKGPVLINGYSWLLINIRTLIRNAVSSCDSKYKDKLTAETLSNVINTEINVINEQITSYVRNNCKVVFYLGGYNSIKELFPFGIFKVAGTDWQKYYQALEEKTLRLMMSIPNYAEYITFDCGFTGNNPKSLIITHLPTDLLSRYKFSELVLLESHTGKIKKHLEWNTKLSSLLSLRIPFNKFTLQVFGDGGNFMTPYPLKIRQAVIDVADKGLWTPAVTIDKMRSDVRSHITDAALKEQLTRML